MYYREEEIRKSIVAYKKADGAWKPYCQQQGSASGTDVVLHGDVGQMSNDMAMASSQPEVLTCAAADQTVLMLPSIYTTDDMVRSVPLPHPESDIQPIPHEQPNDIKSCSEELPLDTLVCQPQMMLNDPASFAGRRLRREDIACQIKAGACQPPDYSFPLNAGRSFQVEWCARKLPDNSTRARQWLTYSISLDRMYCLPCTLFSGPEGSPTWTISGHNNWSSGLRDIIRHESSREHHNAEIANITWHRGKQLDRLLNIRGNEAVDNNRRVIECAVDCVRYLSQEMIAFRGKDSCGGKFMNLFRTMAIRDASAAAYIKKIDEARQAKKKMSVNLISPGNIRLILMTMKQMITERIVNSIRLEQKACLIFDSTQDYSKKEASVLLLRYLETDSSGGCHAVERLLEVFTTGETSGVVLRDEVLGVLRRVGFETEWIVGQCYDGAGNMRGKYSGLATLIQKDCSKAVYIWCHAHRLNLVMNAVMSCSSQVKNTLGILEELHSFMNGHKRNAIFQATQEERMRKMQLKRVSTTRWNSTEAAVETVMSRYSEILCALGQLSDPSSNDSETITAALGLTKRLKDIRVIMCMEVLKIVYRVIGPVSRQLQGISTDLALAAKLLQDCKHQLENVRMNVDTVWETVCESSKSFACRHGINAEFPEERRRVKKRMPGEQSVDSALNGLQLFKVDTFVRALDEVNQQLQSRFADQNVEFLQQLSYFTPVSLLTRDDVNCSDIRGICEQYGLQTEDVVSELKDFTKAYRSLCTYGSVADLEKGMECINAASVDDDSDTDSDSEHNDVYDTAELGGAGDTLNRTGGAEHSTQVKWANDTFLNTCQLLSKLSGYPNLTIMYSIFCCLAVSSASAERALSKLKIVKNRLRSSLCDDMLSALLILSSEKDLLAELSNISIIHRLASASSSLKAHLQYM